LTGFLPGTASGGPVRSIANMIAHLGGDFEFLILTRNTDYQSTEPYPEIPPNTWVQFDPHTKVYYMSADRLSRKELKRVFDSLDFDLAYITGVYSWFFSIMPLQLLKGLKKPILVSARGMLNPQAFTVKPLKKKVFLALAKTLGLYKGVGFHATNEDEALHIWKQLGKQVKVQVAPNLPRKVESGPPKELHGGQRKWVTVARIAKEKGTLNIIKALLKVQEPMVLDLFGPVYDNDYWEPCRQLILELPDHIKVNYKGAVSGDQIPHLLKDYDFFVLLSEGENFGHAIFEAFSQGLPVLISDQTPWKNLKARSLGWDLPLEDAKRIASIMDQANLMDGDTYRNWSASCLAFARSFSEDPDLMNKNKALFLGAFKPKE
jgi:glycosyltransferase involved in cell wall biosynthesis